MLFITILATAALWLASFAAAVLLMRAVLRVGWGDALLAAYPAWWLAQVLITQGLSLIHSITQGALIAATLLLIVAGVVGSRLRGGAHLRGLWATHRWPLVLIALTLAGWAVVALLTPSLIWDTNAYHLPSVATWLQQGSLETWPTACLRQITRTHAGSMQQLWVMGMAHADPLAELPSLLATVPLMAFAWRTARRWRLPRLAPGAVAAMWTAPQFVFAAVACKDDLLLAAAIACSLHLLMLLPEAEPRLQRPYALLLAAAITLVCGVKVPGFLFGGVLGVLALFTVPARTRPLFLGAAVLFAVPVFLQRSIANVLDYGLLYPEQVQDT